LEQTIEESEGLIRTFDALLTIARAESGEVREGMTEFDLAEVARDVSELYEPLAEDKGLTLAFESDRPAAVKGNRELVSQALANLVDNAIKYAAPARNGSPSPSESATGILVKASADRDNAVLTVADNGPGIPEGDRSRVVDRFVRLEQSRSQPGSGLGLSLVSAVARLHGGELQLEDNAPGLRAKLALPRAAMPQQAA
jgi:signal transduction histidine kinase